MKRLILALILITGPLFAVTPDEVLDDPALEARAREISAGLRCVVCQGENIDESNAAIAKDLRLLVRERLLAGDTNDEVVDFIVERYGEYVLMRPTTGGANVILWYAGPALFLLALLGAGLYLRGRSRATETGTALSGDEEARLRELLGD
ncbi:cytochrome c-type biogenesis protein [uncultured Maritimibacter sp.]|jgi:cytochrome c-type biogenesis protein CcmH|uniref:cytochrome c-type biogenesis protein n=1 Tax=uncultured Maritimibacter sp. TaxID=991866 RepID=UPI000AD5D2A1|nr:cytochrome c-type biogenesis protein [uncultured Maritimibacter sp.]